MYVLTFGWFQISHQPNTWDENLVYLYKLKHKLANKGKRASIIITKGIMYEKMIVGKRWKMPVGSFGISYLYLYIPYHQILTIDRSRKLKLYNFKTVRTQGLRILLVMMRSLKVWAIVGQIHKYIDFPRQSLRQLT